MLGYIPPKRFTEVRYTGNWSISGVDNEQDEAGRIADYHFISTPSGQEHTLEGAYSEIEAQRRVQSWEWTEYIEQELDALQKKRDELIASQAVLNARCARAVPRPDCGDAPLFLLDGKELDIFALAEMDDKVRALSEEIEQLDQQEAFTRRLIEEGGWDWKYSCPDLWFAPRGVWWGSHLSNSLIHTEEKDGQTLYYTDLTEKRDGIQKRIYAPTKHELNLRATMERDKARKDKGAPPTAERCQDVIRYAKERITTLSAAETRQLLELMMLAVFGTRIDREGARDMIYRMIGLDYVKQGLDTEEDTMALFEKLDEADKEWDMYTFHRYLNNYLDVEKRSSLSKLAETIGCDKSTLSRIRNGEITNVKKEWAVRLAVAMGLSKEDMRKFIGSAGYTFPRVKKDYIIEQLIDSGVRDYSGILKGLCDYDLEL